MLNPIQMFALHTITKGILIGILAVNMTSSPISFIICGIVIALLFYTFLTDFNDLRD